MRLKLYLAPTMALALAQIRAELGADAAILGSRRVKGGVEVTVGIEPPPGAEAVAGPPDWRFSLARHRVPDPLREALAAGEPEAALTRHLRFGALDLGRPLLVSGPPGAGKTLTVARLATRLVLAGQRPRVITADGDRAGAAEQLGAYTSLLGIDLIVAATPALLARATSRAAGPVLIDAPGINPHLRAERQAAAALAEAAGAALTAVLPAGMDCTEAAEIAEALADCRAAALVATRLDSVRRLGAVLTASVILPLAELGVGPGAADGLIPATPAALLARLRREEEVS
jgi:flagellar biosynthesis protein FlhF